MLLTQTGNDGPWTVSDWVDAQKDWSAPWPANLDRVADLLGDIEQTHVVDWAPEMTGEQAAAPVPGQRTLTFRFRHHLQDEVLVERFGEPFQRPSGAELMPMVRDDDTLPALVPAELATWWQGGAEAWRDSLVWNLPETRVKSLRLIHPDGTARTFLRKIQGTWRYSDTDQEPKDLLPWLDHLIFLRVASHRAMEANTPLHDVLRIEFERLEGEYHVAEIGLDPSGTPVLQVGGHQGLLKNPDLYAGLLGLFRP
ncbi:MAG: hypothetical protein R3F33_09380 [Planctomycetota bacterium]